MAYERLTEADITNLVSAMLDISARHRKYPFTQVFQLAQEKVLPPQKRYRKSVLAQRTKWSKKLQEALKGAGLWPGYTPPAPPPAVVEPPVPEPELQPVVVESPPAPVVQESVPAGVLASQLVERVCSDLWSRINPEIEKRVRERLEAILSRAEQEANEPTEEEKDNTEVIHDVVERAAMPVSIRRVFVIGLLPEQIVVLRRKLAGVQIEMRFWKNEAQTKLAENAEWADEIFLMTKFVSHSDIHNVRNKGREKVRYCNGAVSELERQIRFTIPESATA